jgi:phage terminase Nu1 subunit (DNA packaging protein)
LNQPTPAADFEKLGVFYLGREYDTASRQRTATPLLYDARDLVTHAVCVGMTGSGKTGLCVGLLEEAAIDGIPAIVIDPKGDLSNLLLTFPAQSAADFRPWINPDDARRQSLDPDAFAAKQADRWKTGLADWGQDGARIARLKSAAEFAIYTPGSSAGLPVCALRSFDAPPRSVIEDGELFRERVGSTASSLLSLIGITIDPAQSREHILISSILGEAWTRGENLDIPTLITRIQQPPFARLGVMELETVYPAKDRFGLAMALNNLIAAPGFSAWTQGQPLDIQSLLYTPAGKPRVAIFSIAHLGDAERMFFVSLLLNQVLGWVREQPGTSSLRALIYMDEIAGYFPPVANPPSKQPLLTLMKQARAFGVGVVLATQNPVDLDYKGLANAGTWFIGRLQTDRDKQRVLDGLEGASTQGFDRAQMDSLLSSLSPRVFLMQNVHDSAPTVFETRWCLSYLAGPMTRTQLSTLMQPMRDRTSDAAPSTAPSSKPPAAPASRQASAPAQTRPVLPPEVPQFFIPIRDRVDTLRYVPSLLGTAKVYYEDTKRGIQIQQFATMLATLQDGPVSVDWDHAQWIDITDEDLDREPAPGADFAPLPAPASKPKSYDTWQKQFLDAVYRQHRLELHHCAQLEETSRPNESQRDFRVRLQLIARERRDAAAEDLRARYSPKLATLQERLRKAQQAAEVQREQATGAKFQAAISAGAAILGAFLGRKVASAGNVGRAASAARGVQRTMKEQSDVGRAQETVETISAQIADLESKMREELELLSNDLASAGTDLDTISLKPKKSNISVRAVVLAWDPEADGRSGNAAGRP